MTLQNFDTVLGFALIMLLLSMIVTVLVQFAVTVLSLRGRNLRAGLVQLLSQASPQLKPYAKQVADAVVHHPAIAQRLPLSITFAAKAITRDELLRVLDDLAVNTPEGLRDIKDTLLIATGRQLSPQMKQQAQTVGAELAKIFPAQAQELQGAVLRLYSNTAEVVAGVETWFDSVMARTSDWFTGKTRVWTVVFAFVLAFGAGIDSLSILQQLKSNDAARSRLAQSTQTMQDDLKVLYANTQNTALTSSLDQVNKQLGQIDAKLAETELVIAKGGREVWKTTGHPAWGMLMTGFFLSLGAPFWFNALGQLAKLRPVIASVVDKQAAAPEAAASAQTRAAGAGK